MQRTQLACSYKPGAAPGFDIPEDRLLADLVADKPEIVQHVLKHDSLLEHDDSEQVSVEVAIAKCCAMRIAYKCVQIAIFIDFSCRNTSVAMLGVPTSASVKVATTMSPDCRKRIVHLLQVSKRRIAWHHQHVAFKFCDKRQLPQPTI